MAASRQSTTFWHLSVCLGHAPAPLMGICKRGPHGQLRKWAACWHPLHRVRDAVCLSTDRDAQSADPPNPAMKPRRRGKARAYAPGQGPAVNARAAGSLAAPLSVPAIAPTQQLAGSRGRGRPRKDAAAAASALTDDFAAPLPGPTLAPTPLPRPAPAPTPQPADMRGRGRPWKDAPRDACGAYDCVDERCWQLLGVRLEASPAVRQFISRTSCDLLVMNLEAMVEQLGPELTRAILEKRPVAVMSSCETLAARVQGIKDVWCGETDNSLAKVLRKQPALLSFQPATLAQKVREVSELLGLSREDAVSLLLKSQYALNYTSEALTRKINEISSVLGVDWAVCCKIVKRFPPCLGLSQDTLQAKFTALSEVLGNAQAARTAVIQSSSLLSCTPETHQAKLRALAEVFGPAKALLMVRTQPSLLMCAVDTVASKWASLQRLGAQSPRWDAELRDMACPSLARVLTASEKLHVRLAAVLETRRADAWPLVKTLVLTPQDFQAKLEAMAGRRWVVDVWHGRLAQPDVAADVEPAIPDREA